MKRPTQAEFDAYTVFHTPVSKYRSVIVAPRGAGQDVVVETPVSIISRKDGSFTVKARDARQTVRVSASDTLLGVFYDGTATVINLLG